MRLPRRLGGLVGLLLFALVALGAVRALPLEGEARARDDLLALPNEMLLELEQTPDPTANSTASKFQDGDKLEKDGENTLDEAQKYKKLANEKLQKADKVKADGTDSSPTATSADSCRDEPGLGCSQKESLCEHEVFGPEIRGKCRSTCGLCTGGLAVPGKGPGAQWVVKAVRRTAADAVKQAVSQAEDRIKKLLTKDGFTPKKKKKTDEPNAVLAATEQIMTLIKTKLNPHPNVLSVVQAALSAATGSGTPTTTGTGSPTASGTPTGTGTGSGTTPTDTGTSTGSGTDTGTSKK